MQNWLLSFHGRRLRRQRFDPGYQRLRVELDRLERSPVREQEAYQSGRLSRLVRHCCETVPYYQRVFRERGLGPDDVRSPGDLPKLPVLTREDVRTHLHDLLSRTAPRRQLRLAHTSGTTGSPLWFYWDRDVDRATNAVLWAHRSWAGVEFGEPYATLLGRMIVPPRQSSPPFWRVNRPWNQLILSSFHLDDTTAGSYLEAMRRFGIVALEAYPSTAYILAGYLRSLGATLPLKALFTSAETLLPLQRELIEERFACRVYDYLGEAERVLFAGECPRGRGMHLLTGYGICEVTDDAGNPLGRGERGYLTLTGLHNLAMPLIRYRLGDVSAILPDSCDCGRTLPLMDPVTTKAEDIVVTPEGRLISASVLTHPFKPMRNIRASQIIQEVPERLVIRIVRRAEYTDRDSEILREEFRKRVGRGMVIDLEFVDAIPRTSAGKLRWVISKVPLRFGASAAGNLYGDAGGPGDTREGTGAGRD